MNSLFARLASRATEGSKSSLKRVDYLDGWRGLAISLVLAAHFASLDLLDAGRFGVDVFFVLSGMLMSRILFINRTPLGLFYKRRISRILPVFCLFVSATFSFAYMRDLAFSGEELLATTVFLRTYFPADPGIWTAPVPIGHLWSLNVEEHCYVILSLLAAGIVSVRVNSVVLLTIGAGTLAAIVYYVKIADPAPVDYVLRTECAATGLMLSAGYFLIRDRFAKYVQGWMPIAALLAAAACYSDVAMWWCSLFLAPFCLAFAVNHLGESMAWFRALLTFAPLRLMGIWSYSIYLWQQPFYKFKGSLPPGVAFAVVMAVSIASFYLFENPTRAWLNRKFRSYPARPG